MRISESLLWLNWYSRRSTAFIPVLLARYLLQWLASVLKAAALMNQTLMNIILNSKPRRLWCIESVNECALCEPGHCECGLKPKQTAVVLQVPATSFDITVFYNGNSVSSLEEPMSYLEDGATDFSETFISMYWTGFDSQEDNLYINLRYNLKSGTQFDSCEEHNDWRSLASKSSCYVLCYKHGHCSKGHYAVHISRLSLCCYP
jgi:hypothetical protein